MSMCPFIMSGWEYLKSQILDHKSQILDHKSQILDHKYQILDHKSQISDHKSKISDHPCKGWWACPHSLCQVGNNTFWSLMFLDLSASRIVVLGDRGVGKTSIVQVINICSPKKCKSHKISCYYMWTVPFYITKEADHLIQRLVNNSYSGEHTPTTLKEEHYPRYFLLSWLD